MKFAIFALASVLVLGLCAATEYTESSSYSYDYSTLHYGKHHHGFNDDDDSVEGVPSVLDDIKSEVSSFFGHVSQAGKNFVSTLGNVKNTIVGKVTDLYNRVSQQQHSSGYGSEEQQIKIESRYLYQLPTSYNAEELTGSYLLGDLEFNQVVARNMNFNESKLVVDYKNQKGTLYLYSNRIDVYGKYWKRNFASTNTGNFHIELYNHVSYVENFAFSRNQRDMGYAYQIRWYETPQIEYGKMDQMYENIGLISKMMEGAISDKLLEQLAKKMSAKIHQQLEPVMTKKIGYHAHCGPIKQAIRDMVTQTVQELRQEWSKNGYYRVELPPSYHHSEQEIGSGSYVAKMSYMYLNGLEQFQVEDVHVRMEYGKFGFRVHLGVSPVQGSLIVSVKNAQNENESVRKLNLRFYVDQIHAYLTFAKTIDDKESVFEPRAVHVKVDNAKFDIGSEYEENTRSFIQDELQSYLERTISNRLQTRIEEALTTYLYRGVLPSPQY